jgi:hypothetical protein
MLKIWYFTAFSVHLFVLFHQDLRNKEDNEQSIK